MSDDKVSKVRGQLAKGSLALGQIAKDPREAITAASQAIAGLIRGEGAATFTRVFDSLSKKGELDSDFGNTSKGRYFIQEINDVLSTRIRDEQMLNYKIKLFMAIASNSYKNHSEDEAKKVWQIVKGLDTADIKVIATAHRLRQENTGRVAHKDIPGISGWIRLIAKESGLEYNEFVEESETKLKAQRLINDYRSENYRLTPLGICVAGYLHEGERLVKVAGSAQKKS